MSERAFRIDPTASRVAVRTRATGLLARLAHDLELASAEVAGDAKLDGDAWTAELRVPVASLVVKGTLHGDRLDAAALSASDRAEIERKLRDEVLRGTKDVAARARGSSRDSGEVTISLAGGSARATLRQSTSDEAGALRALGRFDLTLSSLGVAEVKGPLGAFKVSDRVEVAYDLALVPA